MPDQPSASSIAAGPPPAWLVNAVGEFGRDARATLATGVGQPEDALRTPLVNLVKAVAPRIGIRKVVPVGETRLEELEVRPDYAIEVDGAVCGYIEIKKPGLGADAPSLTGKHNARQWQRLSDLPNLIYTDGQNWARYSNGVLDGEIVTLGGTLESGDGELTVPDAGLLRLLTTFLQWKPAPIRSVHGLVRSVAPLCRLLRDEVVDQLRREETRIKQGKPRRAQPFTGLAADWRHLLFPGASNAQFADGYAQTVTFALLLARSRGVDMSTGSIHTVGDQLGSSNALMGRALQLLTDHVEESFRVTLGTLLRVVAAIDWEKIRRGRRDTYLYLYEEFLGEYDDDLRRSSGSYYTPADVVEQMVRLTDDVVRTRLGRADGLGSDGVNVIDPAAGTGTFLLRIIQAVYDRIASSGEGAARETVADLATRLYGFELQMGPHAVSELRVNDALTKLGVELPSGRGVALHVTNTLDDPEQEIIRGSSATIPISESARQARRVKAEVPVTVVIGNPPYRERAIDDGGWVAHGADRRQRNLMDDFRLDGNGRVEYVLHNLAWYFWRWGTWKVFDQHEGSQHHGVVTFITTAAYLRGPGFAGMRRYLRRTCDEGWIIDLTPEGMRPDVATRVFPGVQQTLAIGIFVRRRPDTPSDKPARIRYRSVHGRRAEKYAALAAVDLDEDGWADTRSTPDTAPFTPAHALGWDDYPALLDLLPVSSPGVKANRGWVFAPRAETLTERWADLVTSDTPEEQALKLKETPDRKLDSTPAPLPGFRRAEPLTKDSTWAADPVPVGYRSFDRQYVVPDSRVIDRPRPALWAVRSPTQLYCVEQHNQPISSGPGLVFSALIPDMHMFNNRGGRVLPAFHGNGQPTTIAAARALIGSKVLPAGGGLITGEALVAYIAAVTAHPGYTARFAEQLDTPGIRVPLTADADLWKSTVAIGRRVVWLHTYGERFVDESAERPRGGVANAGGAPVLNLDGIPSTEEGMPTVISHSSDLASRRHDDDGDHTLYIDAARFSPVPAAVWRYDVGGRRVVKSWFDSRRRSPAGRRSSPLDDINARRWVKADTDELIRLLGVLGGLVRLEGRQAELLDAVCAGPLISHADLVGAAALPTPPDRKLR